MSNIRINATVYYAPGPWGLNVPIHGASVEIWDKDLTNSDDKIFSGTTDANGHVDGMSSDWVDMVNGLPQWVCDRPGPFGTCIRGHWHTPKIPDPSDLKALLYAKISFQGNHFTVPLYPYVDDRIEIPLIIPWSPPLVTKDQRALIVMSYLVPPASPDFRCLYAFLDYAGISVAQNLLSADYSSVIILKDNDASTTKLIAKIGQLASDANIKAIDLILNMHGLDEQIAFQNGDFAISAISAHVNSAGNGKLRMLYSTACFGSSHNDDWLSAGFKVSAGAKKVNANSMTEYPTVLTAWKNGTKFNDCISLGEAPITRVPMDTAALWINSAWVANSDKDVAGNGNITIGT